jgi:hypothetical protein
VLKSLPLHIKHSHHNFDNPHGFPSLLFGMKERVITVKQAIKSIRKDVNDMVTKKKQKSMVIDELSEK